MKIKYTLPVLVAVLLFIACKENKTVQAKVNIIKNINSEDCIIPTPVLSYIHNNKDTFSLVYKKDFYDFKTNTCLYSVKGDFNDNGKEDIAIILRYNNYKNTTYKNYKFPFLVIFNDYLDGVKKPDIVFKSEDYKYDDIQTVIYDQFEKGIYCYIEHDFQCKKDVVKINIPEKSVFYVMWNGNERRYQYIHSTDLDCASRTDEISTKNSEKISNIKLSFSNDRTNKVDTIYIEDGSSKLSIIQDNHWINAPIKYEIKGCKNNDQKVVVTYLGNTISGKIYTLHKINGILKVNKIATYTVGASNTEVCENSFNTTGNRYTVISNAVEAEICKEVELNEICD